jgi:hypothetical protein
MKIFAMNDCDWYAAETLEDALKAMAKNLACEATDEGIAEMRNDFDVDEPVELTDEDMDRLKFREEEEDGTLGVAMLTFREKLDEMIADGDEFPCFFASTEG